MSNHRILRWVPVILFAAVPGCIPASDPSAPSAAPPDAGASSALAGHAGAAMSEQPTSSGPPSSSALLPDTLAGRQLAAWLEAFNGGDRQALLDYHECCFPYSVASPDVSDIEREYRLRQATGGFDVQRIEQSAEDRVEVLIHERNRPQYARAHLQVSLEPPHSVTLFRIGPIPTPPELLTPEERQARAMDAKARSAAIDSIGRQLEAHYIFAETAARVNAVLLKKQARGDYETLTDALAFAGALARDLRRLTRDKHVDLRFGPMPPEAPFDGPAPPWVASVDYGFGPSTRLESNVAHLVIDSFPPLFDEER